MKAHFNGGAFSQVKRCTPTTARGLKLLGEAKESLESEKVRDARRLKKMKSSKKAMVTFGEPTKDEDGTLDSFWTGVSKDQVHEAWARMCYADALPFSLMDSPWFEAALDLTIKHVRSKGGSHYKAPTRQLVATKYLDKEKARTNKALKVRLFGAEPKTSAGKIVSEYGLSITSDGWSDRSRKPFMNCLIGTPNGFLLLASKDFSGQVKDGECIFQYIKSQIEESDVSQYSVRTTILDGTSANKSAFRKLEAEFPWMECQRYVWLLSHYCRCTRLLRLLREHGAHKVSFRQPSGRT
jgi:hypothetical protein